jgi:hypothetical protein
MGREDSAADFLKWLNMPGHFLNGWFIQKHFAENSYFCDHLTVPLRYFEFLIPAVMGGHPFGRAIVGVPQDQMLELKKEFPDHEVRGEDPWIQVAIQDGITENARARIVSALRLSPGTTITFQMLSIPTADVPPSDRPKFESDGKSFWVRFR